MSLSSPPLSPPAAAAADGEEADVGAGAESLRALLLQPRSQSPAVSARCVFILEPMAQEAGDADADQHQAVQLCNEYGKSTACEDLRLLLAGALGTAHGDGDDAAAVARVQVVPIGLRNVDAVLDGLPVRASSTGGRFVVVNLCDGCETDGYPVGRIGAWHVIDMLTCR